MLFEHRCDAWVKSVLVRVQSEIWILKSVVGKTFAQRCSSDLFMLRFDLFDHVLDSLKRFRSLPFLEARPFENFNVLVAEFCRTKSRRLLTRMHETTENMDSTLDSVQRPESEIRGGFFGASVLRKKVWKMGGIPCA